MLIIMGILKFIIQTNYIVVLSMNCIWHLIFMKITKFMLIQKSFITYIFEATKTGLVASNLSEAVI